MAGRYFDRYNSSMTEEITSKEEKSVDGFVDLWMKRMRKASRACDRVPLVAAEISGRGWSDGDSEKAMYEGPKTRVNGRKVFSVRVGVHQGSLLSPLLLVLIVIVLEGSSIETSDKACS